MTRVAPTLTPQHKALFFVAGKIAQMSKDKDYGAPHFAEVFEKLLKANFAPGVSLEERKKMGKMSAADMQRELDEIAIQESILKVAVERKIPSTFSEEERNAAVKIISLTNAHLGVKKLTLSTAKAREIAHPRSMIARICGSAPVDEVAVVAPAAGEVDELVGKITDAVRLEGASMRALEERFNSVFGRYPTSSPSGASAATGSNPRTR